MTENGRWAVVEPTEDGFEVLNKGRVDDAGFSGSPIVADGRLYFPSTTALYCVASEGAIQQPVVMAESMGDESDVGENSEVAQLLVVPAESLIEPGEKIELSAHAYNSIGQKLDDPSEVIYEVDGPGKIDGSTLIADSDAAHTAVTITARSGDASGIARVRIVPPLPWKFTFDDLNDPPLSWVGARYRHVVREIDGSPALTKVNTIPKGARSRAWMGPSGLAEYTISADVRGSRMSDQLPDIGLTGHGYVLDLMGQSQQLQIRTWSAQLRLSKFDSAESKSTVEFPWEEDQWYRMKFRVDIEKRTTCSGCVAAGQGLAT